MGNPRRTQAFISALVLAAVGGIAYAGFLTPALHLYYSCALLTLAAATSKMKVKLPGINGNMSVNLPFLLTATVTLSSIEAIAIAAACTLVQCWPKRGSTIQPQQLVFNVSMMVAASSIACSLCNAINQRFTTVSSSVEGIIVAGLALFLGQTAPVATVIGLSEGGHIGQIWLRLAQLSFPYYVVSAGVTSMVQGISRHLGWGIALGLFPVMYAIHRSYRLYFATGMASPQEGMRANGAAAGA